MNSLFSNLIALVVVLTLSQTSSAQKTQDAGGGIFEQQDGMLSFKVPKNLKLLLELRGLLGRNLKGCYWEVSYKWYIGDKLDVDKQLLNGIPISFLNGGLMIGQGSSRLSNLSNTTDHQIKITAPVKDDLLKRIRNNGVQRQVLWVVANVLFHDAKLGKNLPQTVETVWSFDVYPNGMTLTIEVTKDGKIDWTRPLKSPGMPLQSPKIKKS